MSGSDVSLCDKYTATEGRIYLTGTQALVRLPMTQMRIDRAAGLNTAALITGYRGSPLGSYDLQLTRAQKHLDKYDVTLQPGINEDLAATAIWGTQQVNLSPGANKDGVLGIWYGKGPGVDRSGDVFKHGNAAGSSRHGGVLCLAGDDHTCKSSTIPHQSDHAFMSALMPVLYPSSIHEFLEIGLLGIAMSRYSGCWVGIKFISETVETSSVVDLAGEQRQFKMPEDFDTPGSGLNLRWPDPPLIQDERLQEYKGYAAIAFARANRIDEITFDTPNARFGIVASGKAFEDVLQALDELGIGNDEVRRIGLRLYKVRMTWPLEPEGIRRFSTGLEEVFVVEERREIIENQIKQQLFNWRADVRPRIVGKFDHRDKPFLSLSKGLTVGALARAIADRLLHFPMDEDLRKRISNRLSYLENRHKIANTHIAPITRQPCYCSGCPHNTSTRVPQGSRAMVGIGCHFMVQWMDRNSETFTQMGGEGVPWTAIGRYTDEKHMFANLGDGTYFHSGLLAIRQSVSAGANITYKILYNDAVAMTGGQPVDGKLTPEQITHQLHQEGVKPIYLLSDAPENYRQPDLAPGVIIKHRDHIDTVMKQVRDIPGCSAIVYEQTCAAEKRRRRKRGLMEDPDKRVFINPALCEGCGDCSAQSNCISIEPQETAFGRKRKINQSSCNKDFSCLKGFCPSFVTVRGGKLKMHAPAAGPDISGIPAAPERPNLKQPWNIAVTGIGGTGVLTIGAILGMAAHIEGKSPMILDMAGLAQKGGAVFSHIRIAEGANPIGAPRIANGGADLLLAADSVVAASKDGISLCDPGRTYAVVNGDISPVSDFVRNRDFNFQSKLVMDTVRKTIRSDDHFHNFTEIALAVAGNEIASNILMLGYAWQLGFVPLDAESIEQAIEINGVATQANTDAFRWGRIFANEPMRVKALIHPATADRKETEMSLDELVKHRFAHLVGYQGILLAEQYRSLVAHVRDVARSRLSQTGKSEKLVRAVARNYAKVLSYKDEYEVARLFTSSDFRQILNTQFEGDFRLSFNLAPPFLPGNTPNGRPKKREFGAFTLKLFWLLARLKCLRGTLFDIFGYTRERKAERELIKTYEQDIEDILQRLCDASADTAISLLSIPDVIRGFGPVKEEALAAANKERATLLDGLQSDYASQLAVHNAF